VADQAAAGIGDELGELAAGRGLDDAPPVVLVRSRRGLGERLEEGERAVREHLQP
jgi:hypothetical protein